MQLSRRTLLAVVPTLTIPGIARADDAHAESKRTLGNPDAPVSVIEFYSLTCSHCADFSRETFPQVKTELIDTGKLYYEFWDFPLDRVALAAAMVARSLPAGRYEPFIAALLASQDRWAFARGVNPTEELAKMAALAGMPRPEFDKAISDTALQSWILQHQDEAQKTYGIDSTPNFVFNGKAMKNYREPGAVDFDAFAKDVAKAAG